MTFLQYSSGLGKKAVIALMIISIITLTVFSQKTNSHQQGRRYGEAGFEGEPVNLNVVNADIRDILSYITEQYGVNFVIDKSVQKVPVTVNISDVPWNIALDAILRSQELGVQVSGPILRIADSKILATEQDLINKANEGKLDNSTLYTEFIRLNYARASGSIQSAGFSTGTASNSGASTSGGGGASTGGEGLLPIIKRRLSRRGAIEVDSRSNSLIITDVRENIDAIRQLVAVLDQPEPQVEIEARVVIASRDFSRDIGVQLSGLVLGRNGAGGTGSTLPTALSTGSSGTTATTTNGPLTAQPNSNLASQLANSVIGLTTGIFGTAQINLLLTAGEKTGQSKTIATPRITTLNNRTATIESGQQIPIVTTQTGANGSSGVVFTTTYVSVPLKLEVTPQITDANTVLLDVSVENSSVSSTVAVGGTPAINTSRMKTQAMVPDGGTTVVGGALLDVEGEDQFRTPGLSRVPIVGNLFKRKAVAKTTNEILFFITPRIYRPDYEGNPTPGGNSNTPRSATIIQPVPLGNPPSNSTTTPDVQPVPTPLLPVIQPTQQQNPTKQP